MLRAQRRRSPAVPIDPRTTDSPRPSTQPNTKKAETRLARDWGAPLFVWGIWAVMLVVTIAHARAYANHIPRWDDNALIAQQTGEEPVTAKWLWSLHGEHRIVLPRLLHLGLFRAAGYDLRAGAVFNVIALAVV